MSAWIANAIARVYFVWFQMSSALSRKGTECCRRTWKPHSTTFRTCNDQKKMPTYTHARTRLGTLPMMIMMMMLPALPGDVHPGRPLRPHITSHHISATTTITYFGWQSTSVPVLVRCKLISQTCIFICIFFGVYPSLQIGVLLCFVSWFMWYPGLSSKQDDPWHC